MLKMANVENGKCLKWQMLKMANVVMTNVVMTFMKMQNIHYDKCNYYDNVI